MRSPSPIVLDSVVTTPITCFDAEDGVIEIFAHGGTISNDVELYTTTINHQ